MTISTKIGTISYDDERARGHGHDPVILTGAVTADQGELPVGLILTKDESDEFVPYQEVEDEVLGTGNGSLKAFSGTLTNLKVEPGTVVVSDGVESFSDNGFGVLTGDADGSGTINYDTGAISVTFAANVGDTVEVVVDYKTRVDGVLDETIDTTKTTASTYIVHGSVRLDALKVGAASPADPDAALLKILSGKGIYAS